MGLLHRKLIEDAINSTVSRRICQISCLPVNVKNLCPQLCLDFDVCPEICLYPLPSLLSPPPPPPSVPSYLDEQSNKHHLKISPLLIATVTFLAAAFLFVCCYAIYSRYYLGRREDSRRTRPQPQTVETQDEFLDEEDGPVLDHPIWYIRTVGLQPSIIGSIAVCKYKRGEGLVEGAECSVCLNEFEEDETLRLLPKCSHAFHVPCIDTWLRSHTNCPMCRAPIVKNTVLQTPPPEANVNTSSPGEETSAGISQSGSASDGEIDDEARELRIEIDDEGELAAVNDGKLSENSNQDVNDVQPMRRSVSLDSLSASKISFAVANRVSINSHANSHNQGVKVNESNTRIVPKRFEGNRNSSKLLGSSSKGRALTNRPVSMKRSFSWNGKFLLFNYSQSRDLVIRSF